MAEPVTSVPRLSLPIVGERVRIDAKVGAARQGELVIVRRQDGARIGRVVVAGEGHNLVVEALCIEAGERGYGAGSDAAWHLVEAARASGFALVRAWAPADLGLAVFFWIRQGFRPRFGPGPDDGVWLERRLVPEVVASTASP